ncbi:GCN5-related N-acetyltransferas-like protein [Massarina eburnea CBS 473.64]|uniref:GCN5-related N-acetyltransferas-like protein n=1 Tax=Massarina eburnea CBS 473.64 TaxID=1395130 RepID=A0A6A6RVD1_9PLEO|nr:GCN5-related N-acetyltransferas-like protein [Massarina eburnea CBS 473.64]
MASDGATIRHAARDDVQTIYDLIHELAAYEKATSSVAATPELLAKTLAFHDPTSSSPDPFTPGYARTFLLVIPEGAIAGMALYFYNYSTWTGVPGVYLEDLFVKPEFRKRGYGKALIKACAKEVVRIGGKRLEWSCLDWNEPSLRFYESLGAERKDKWVGLRAEGSALEKLAE